jgi:hypothetical protein
MTVLDRNGINRMIEDTRLRTLFDSAQSDIALLTFAIES